MKRLVFALAFALLAAALVVVMMNESRIEKENERLREEKVTVGFVQDGERFWIRVKSKYRFDAISCDGDSISVKVGTDESDTTFTKITVADLMAAKANQK